MRAWLCGLTRIPTTHALRASIVSSLDGHRDIGKALHKTNGGIILIFQCAP